MRLLRTTVLLLLVAACARTGEITLVGPADFQPPDWYRDAWTEVVDCVGPRNPGRSSFDRITWTVAEVVLDNDRDVSLAGYWNPPHDVYLAWAFADDRLVVMHEMLHEVLGPSITHGHPDFVRCDPIG